MRGCSERRPGAGPAAPAGGRGRQPAGPARRDGPHHRRLSRLHQGQSQQNDKMKNKNPHNCLLNSQTDRVSSAGVGGNLRQHEDPGGLDCPGGCSRQGPP